MKIALITDLHIGARNDSPLFHDYYERFYSNTFFPRLKADGIDTVIFLGDTFDKRKQINFVSFERSLEYLFNPLKSNGITVYCLVGNHDAPLKNHIKVSSSKLLLSQFDNIEVIDTPREIVLDGVEFLMLPWVCPDNQADSTALINKTKATILCGHLELAGFEMHKGQLSEHGQFELGVFKKFDKVWSGHYHHRSSQGNITYLGNPYELTWSDYDDPRGFHIYDTQSDTLEFVENSYRMFCKVFYNDEDQPADWITEHDFSVYTGVYVKVIVVKKKDFLAFDTFVHKLQEANPIECKVIEDFSEFEESAIDDATVDIEDTCTLLDAYIDGVATEVDKERLKKLMHELYAEAQASGFE